MRITNRRCWRWALSPSGRSPGPGSGSAPRWPPRPASKAAAAAAQLLGIDRIWPGERIWVGGQWFYVAGILKRATLAPEIDTSVLIGFPATRTYLRFGGHPSTIYVRAATSQVPAVQSVLAAIVNPAAPNEVNVSQPSAALTARVEANSAFNSLFLGLSAVALLVGAVGVANTMVISVLERRSEIGLRRALGAAKGQIRTQFLAEAILLAVLGGAAGVHGGSLATAVYAHLKGWAIVLTTEAWAGGDAATLAVGALAGLLPAIRAARMSPPARSAPSSLARPPLTQAPHTVPWCLLRNVTAWGCGAASGCQSL
jgi:putative ABC transport system permease protein